jgi:hypothetical protein
MTEQFARKLSALVNEEISIKEFQRWFVGYLMNDDGVDFEDQPTADQLENVMAEFTGGYISKERFVEVVKRHLDRATIVSSLLGSAQRPLRSSSSAKTVRVEFVAVT